MDKKRDLRCHTIKNAGISLLFSAAIILFFSVYSALVVSPDGITISDAAGMLLAVFRRGRFYPAVLLFAVLLFLFLKFREKVSLVLYRYRFLICLLVFAACVALRLNGSSIGMWSGILRQPETGVIAGLSRSVRSDEWFVSTPMAFSQYFNFPEPFSYFGEVLRGAPTDMFLEYGQPVRCVAEIFRPFHWGYLFLPPAYGLSFFWCGRLIALFLASFEFGMLLTEKNKTLSLAYSLFVVLAPVVQWWFAINGLVEMLIYIQVSVLLLRKYLETDSRGRRAAFLAGILLCAGGYILTMYPAWMIPLGYILAGALIGVWILSFNRACWKKTDAVILAAELALFCMVMGYVFLKSRSTINAFLHTEYPGSRFFTGGHALSTSTNYLANIWYAIRGTGSYANECESARFFDFFPVCYLFPVWCIIKEKCRDRLLLILLAVSLFLEIYALAGFPAALAKVTLLSNCNSHRVLAVAGLCNLFLLFRSLSFFRPNVRPCILAAFGAAAAVICVLSNAQAFPEFYKNYVLAGTIILAAGLFAALFTAGEKRGQKVFLTGVCLVMAVSGLLVNPIRRGISGIYESETIRRIRDVVAEDPEALWIVEGEDVPVINLLIMAGARTVNSTNVYPCMERWESLDGGENSFIYNRYAHIRMDLTETEQVQFSLIQDDYFRVECPLSSLEQMQVRYIFTENDLSRFTDLELVAGWDTYRIYERV